MASSPLGRPTRGTTGTNRLRRNDRWIAASNAFRTASDPLVIDLGYGASGVTAFELATRLARVRPDAEVLGLELDPSRV
ncbi:MAG TPA: class I SAM-dependent methyltransferase, partial [Microbacterium sp.]|nr:class I SAM-dependent methyltransferase [Microbacterium sp.]